jgi:hypothetical protein
MEDQRRLKHTRLAVQAELYKVVRVAELVVPRMQMQIPQVLVVSLPWPLPRPLVAAARKATCTVRRLLTLKVVV